MTQFYDSVTPASIPAGSDACLYIDGDFEAPPSAAKRFARTRWITVHGTAPAAAGAGIADFEQRNPVYMNTGALYDWAHQRRVLGYRARVYSNLSNLFKAWEQVGQLPNVVWWIATLDGKQVTAAQLVADVLALGVTLAEEKIWGVQYAGGPGSAYDTSLLLGSW